MKKVSEVLAVIVIWLMMIGIGTACAVTDPGCSQDQNQNQGQNQNQSQNQGQLQGQGQIQGQVSTNLNTNANLNTNLNSVNNKNDIKNTNTNLVAPIQNTVSNTTSSAVSGPSTSSSSSVSSATGGNATGGNATATGGTAYGGAGGQGGQGGAGGNSTVTSSPTSSANNSLTVLYPEEKRELPNIPNAPVVNQLEFRGPYGKGMYQFIAPWKIVSEWNKEMLDGFPTCYWNCDVEIAKIFKTIFAPKRFKVVKESKGILLGWIIIKATNPLEMWGKVAEIAFDFGTEEVVENAFQSTFSNKSGGWNVGIGGGVTAVSGGNDNVGGSIGPGVGVGSVETEPVEKCQAVFTFYGK